MKRKPTADEMLVRIAGLCAGAEQCAADIRQKIIRQGFSSEEAGAMIEYLISNRYIDDARYARAYAVDKVRLSGWGKIKVRMGLKAKGMSDSIIAQALDYIPEKDYAVALEKVLHTKSRHLDLTDVKDRQRLYRHLASRGFESSIAIPAIRSFVKKQNEAKAKDW